MWLKKIFVVPFIAVIAFAAISFSPSAEWRKIGEKNVDYLIDHDIMEVTAKAGKFSELKFEVAGAGLNLHKCTVHFEGGGSQDLDIKQQFDKNSSSRVIDLKGNKRFIEKIGFWYDTQKRSEEKAVITVYEDSFVSLGQIIPPY